MNRTSTIDGRLSDVEDPSTCRDWVGARSTARKAAQRDREASLDRCAVRMRAGDEPEEARQGLHENAFRSEVQQTPHGGHSIA